MTARPWLVLDMDDGLLRRERTRKAAVEWLLDHCDAPQVVSRDDYRSGAYGYHVGTKDDTTSAFIEHERAAPQGGWDVTQAALYPHEDAPHEYVPRPQIAQEAP